jgi:hypothetical protein
VLFVVQYTLIKGKLEIREECKETERSMNRHEENCKKYITTKIQREMLMMPKSAIIRLLLKARYLLTSGSILILLKIGVRLNNVKIHYKK